MVLVIPLQLPTPHSTTINSGGGNGAINAGGGGWACDSPSVTHTTLYYNQFWWSGLVLVILFPLPTPHSTTVNSGGWGLACDSPSVTQTTLHYSQFWW